MFWTIVLWTWLGIMVPVFVIVMSTGFAERRNGLEIGFPTMLMGSAFAAFFWPTIPFYILWDKWNLKNKRDKITMEMIRDKTDQLEKQLKVGKYAK